MSSVSSSSDENNSGAPKGKNGGKVGGVKRGIDRQGEELATKVLSIQSKRFYLDVKQNDRGRFIKFAEVAGFGKKSRIFMSLRTSNQFKDHLTKFIEMYEKLGELPEEAEPKLIHSETIVNDKRRYYLDLRENNRGYFLRVTQLAVQFGSRLSVTFPAQGMAELRDALVSLLDEYGDATLKVELPETRTMRADNKHFYFDPGQNDRGVFLKISEVKPAFSQRSSINISARSLPQFCAIISELHAKLQKLQSPTTTTTKEEEEEKEATAKNDAQSGSGGGGEVAVSAAAAAVEGMKVE